jgi:hypothetical protein
LPVRAGGCLCGRRLPAVSDTLEQDVRMLGLNENPSGTPQQLAMTGPECEQPLLLTTINCLKYRRGSGEIVIVNHDGRGWWDPLSEAKGDVFSLVQHLEPSLNFAQARHLLRGFVGIAPTFPEALRVRRVRVPRVPLARRWSRRQPLSRGSPAWLYLTA